MASQLEPSCGGWSNAAGSGSIGAEGQMKLSVALTRGCERCRLLRRRGAGGVDARCKTWEAEGQEQCRRSGWGLTKSDSWLEFGSATAWALAAKVTVWAGADGHCPYCSAGG